MAKLKIAKTNSVSGQIVDAYTSQTLISGNHVGSVGGIHSQVGPQIKIGRAHV